MTVHHFSLTTRIDVDDLYNYLSEDALEALLRALSNYLREEPVHDDTACQRSLQRLYDS